MLNKHYPLKDICGFILNTSQIHDLGSLTLSQGMTVLCKLIGTHVNYEMSF